MRILVIEDDIQLAENLRTALESGRENLERVGHFASGREWGREG